MSVRPRALIASIVMLVATVGMISLAVAAGPAGANRALPSRCVRSILGGGAAARPVAGSGAAITSELSALRRPRTAADALPAGAHLAALLGDQRSVTYDPSALVRLRRLGATSLYAVPVTLAPVALPVGCSGRPALSGVIAFIAAQADQHGSGPGACLIATQWVPSLDPGALPGARATKPGRHLQITGLTCRSVSVMATYLGALGDQSESGFALIPDGISAVTYTLASGRRFTVAVRGNLVGTPRPVIMTPRPPPETATQLASHLPTTITETGASGQPVATLNRPDSVIADVVGEFTFLKRLFAALELGGSQTGAYSTGEGSVSCRRQTHRCLAVSVTTTCNARHRCRTTRTIHRYRYVGPRPPRGTVGAGTLPTAPVVGRVDRFVRRPGRLSLVLSGPAQAHVGVIETVSCVLRGGEAVGGGPPLTRAVPSRSRISLPGAARRFSACDIGVLVTSTRPGRVRVRIVRG